MVLLEGQHVIRASRHELRRHCPLAAHRIERDDTAPNLHQVEHLRDGDQLVTLGFHRRLGQAHALLGRPDAHELDRGLTLTRGRRAAQLLAIDNQVATSQQGHNLLPPLAQAALQFGGHEVAKDPVERVVGGTAGR